MLSLGDVVCVSESWHARTFGSLWGPQERIVESEPLPKPCDFGGWCGADGGGRGRGGGWLTRGPSLRKSFYASITSPLTPPLFLKTPLHCSPLSPFIFPAPFCPRSPKQEAWFLALITALPHLLPRNQLGHWWKLRLVEVK